MGCRKKRIRCQISFQRRTTWSAECSASAEDHHCRRRRRMQRRTMQPRSPRAGEALRGGIDGAGGGTGASAENKYPIADSDHNLTSRAQSQTREDPRCRVAPRLSLMAASFSRPWPGPPNTHALGPATASGSQPYPTCLLAASADVKPLAMWSSLHRLSHRLSHRRLTRGSCEPSEAVISIGGIKN